MTIKTIYLMLSLLTTPLLMPTAHAEAAVPVQPQAQNTSQSVTLDVQNMTCAMCPITIRKALQGVDGVNEAQVDFASKTAAVTFDPQKTNIAALIKATTNAGYPATAKDGGSVAKRYDCKDAGGRATQGAVAEETAATDRQGWRPRLLPAVVGISSIPGGQKCRKAVRLQGCRRYDSKDGIGRVESGTETESNAGSCCRGNRCDYSSLITNTTGSEHGRLLLKPSVNIKRTGLSPVRYSVPTRRHKNPLSSSQISGKPGDLSR